MSLRIKRSGPDIIRRGLFVILQVLEIYPADQITDIGPRAGIQIGRSQNPSVLLDRRVDTVWLSRSSPASFLCCSTSFGVVAAELHETTDKPPECRYQHYIFLSIALVHQSLFSRILKKLINGTIYD